MDITLNKKKYENINNFKLDTEANEGFITFSFRENNIIRKFVYDFNGPLIISIKS
jgi:hypothetical protein